MCDLEAKTERLTRGYKTCVGVKVHLTIRKWKKYCADENLYCVVIPSIKGWQKNEIQNRAKLDLACINLLQTTMLCLFQTERVCSGQFQI